MARANSKVKTSVMYRRRLRERAGENPWQIRRPVMAHRHCSNPFRKLTKSLRRAGVLLRSARSSLPKASLRKEWGCSRPTRPGLRISWAAQERTSEFARRFFMEGMEVLKTHQNVAQSIVAAQERNMKFFQGFFTEGMEALKNQ